MSLEYSCSYLPQDIDFASYPDSSSTMSPPFVNSSCNPFAPRSADCVVGTYVSYSIRVEGASDISAGIKFANDNNIRLIIRASVPSIARKGSLTSMQATLATTSMAKAPDLVPSVSGLTT